MAILWCIVSSYAFLHSKEKNKTQTHNAHTAFRIKTNRSSYLSPLIIWCSMRCFYTLDTSLNSSLVAYAANVLHCLLLCCFLFEITLIKNLFEKFMALTKKIAFQIFSQLAMGSRNLREITRSRILVECQQFHTPMVARANSIY